MIFSPMNKMLFILSCLVITSYAAPANNVATTDPQMPTTKPVFDCGYSNNDRKGALPEWMQEDPIISGEELSRMNDEFYVGPYMQDKWHVSTDRNQLTLESNIYRNRRLRLVEITTMDDKITYVYLADWEKCTAELKGNIPKSNPVMKKVRVLTLKGKP